VVNISSALLAIGMVLALSVDSPTTRPNLQTVGLALMLIGLTALAVALHLRDPARRR
jgi:hypothetical protein